MMIAPNPHEPHTSSFYSEEGGSNSIEHLNQDGENSNASRVPSPLTPYSPDLSARNIPHDQAALAAQILQQWLRENKEKFSDVSTSWTNISNRELTKIILLKLSITAADLAEQARRQKDERRP